MQRLLVGALRNYPLRSLSSSSALKRQLKAEKKLKEKAEKQVQLEVKASSVSTSISCDYHMTITLFLVASRRQEATIR